MSLLVNALFSPLANCKGVSKDGTLTDPPNIKCSNKWANPVLCSFSSLAPTLYSKFVTHKFVLESK